MNFELFVALRYLRARRKQALISVVTVISVVGVAAGVVALNVALALNAGFQSEFRNRILGATSHVNLVGLGGGVIDNVSGLADELSTVPGVVSVLPAIYTHAVLRSGIDSKPAILKGVDAGRENAFRILVSGLKVLEGHSEDFVRSQEPPAIALGKELAQSLTASAGEVIRAFGLRGELGPTGFAPRLQTFKVAFIFESGLWEVDANWALIPIQSARKFNRLGEEQATALEFRIEDVENASNMADLLRKKAGEGHSTNTWMELNRPLFSALRLERLAMAVAIGLIVLVASLNIVSTLMLMVMEKNRDIAIVTAMGGTAETVTRIFRLQGLIIGLAGTVAGDLLGGILIWYLHAYKVFPLDPQVYSISYVPFQMDALDMVIVSIVAVLISYLATLYPSRAATRLDPVEALRYE